MSQHPPSAPRVLVAAVTPVRSRSIEDLAKVAVDAVRAAGFTFVRSVVVKGEPQFIQQLVSHVSNDNEADAILMLGGTGIGPRDITCEALDSFVERKMEGFGEAYRRMLREEFEVATGALLTRATAGVYNQCVVFALTGQSVHVRRAIETLIVPALPDAVVAATGGVRAHDPTA
jgi:molybdenum cofactor biosynthesis protein B